MSSVKIPLTGAQKRLEVRDGRRVLVISNGVDEVVLVPPDGDPTDVWLAVWSLGIAIDRLSGELGRRERTDVHRGNGPR